MKNVSRAGNHQPVSRRFVCVVVAVLGWGCATTVPSQGVLHTLGVEAREHGVEYAWAHAILAADDALAQGDAAAHADWLHGALEHREGVHDDAAWRERVARADSQTLRGTLLAVQSTERARRLLVQGDRAGSLDLAQRALSHRETASPLTVARAELLVVLSSPERVDPGEEAMSTSLARVRQRVLDGPLGVRLRERVTVLEAAIHQRQGRYQEAIDLYLSLPMGSGLYREARMGLAWCQMKIHQPERSLKILALLPGGLTGDPDRALLAAMAAHALGKIDAAQAIITESLAQRPELEAETVKVEGVLESVASGKIKPLLRGPRENLTLMVATQPGILALCRSLIALGVSASSPAAAQLVAAHRARLSRRVEQESMRQLSRLRVAWENLGRLAPQIR